MDWKTILTPVLQSPEILQLKSKLQEFRKTKEIYPEGKNIFKPFDLCPFDKTRVVILGDEPYASAGLADGLAFSTQSKERPKVLEIIFKEIYKDLNIQYYGDKNFEEYFPSNDLTKWAENGFLLLNTCFTVEKDNPGSHKDLGWNFVVEKAITALNGKEKQVIFLLWGDNAKKYKKLIKSPHIYLEAEHPKVETYQGGNNGFYDCKHFSILRDILPIGEGIDIFPKEDATHFFDKEKAKEYFKQNYPITGEKMCQYIDRQLIINIPVNADIYDRETRKFENIISTQKI